MNEKSVVNKKIDDLMGELAELSERIWNTPELAYHEFNAAKWTCEILKSHGFNVELGYGGLDTAVRGSFGEGKPVIGFISEYDALPGMSQIKEAVRRPVEEGKPGHACGHNLMNSACLGAAIAVKDALVELGKKGTVVFYGCPAEEVLTGKPEMAKNGAFKELDVALAFHPSNTDNIPTGINTAVDSLKINFKGKAAHAAKNPWDGRSALDAVELTDIGANYLREHVPSDVRLHYSITDGGGMPNTVPEKASVWYYIRALSREHVEDTRERLLKVAKGAAIATETEAEVEFLGGCYETLPNMVLAKVLYEAAKKSEKPEWSSEEKAFAEKLNSTSSSYKAMVNNGEVSREEQLFSKEIYYYPENKFASTDLSDVQHIVPGIQLQTACWNLGATAHDWMACACAGGSIGLKGMKYAVQILANSAMDLVDKPEILAEAKDEFDRKTKGKKYKCPIPDEKKIKL